MSTSVLKKNLTNSEDDAVKSAENRYRSTSITIRTTVREKELITRCAQKQGYSISAYLIESAIHSESSICSAVLPLVKEIRKLSNIIKTMDQSLCDADRRTPALDDVVELQKQICEMMQTIAINI